MDGSSCFVFGQLRACRASPRALLFSLHQRTPPHGSRRRPPGATLMPSALLYSRPPLLLGAAGGCCSVLPYRPHALADRPAGLTAKPLPPQRCSFPYRVPLHHQPTGQRPSIFCEIPPLLACLHATIHIGTRYKMRLITFLPLVCNLHGLSVLSGSNCVRFVPPRSMQ